LLRDLIARDRGEAEAKLFEQFQMPELDLVASIGGELLEHTPVFHGACATMSAAWVALLRDRCNIPAVAVAGDLTIEARTIFVCASNLPESTTGTEITAWDGHCWIEIANVVGDVSIFRTARTSNRLSRLRAFIEENFGLEQGLLLCRRPKLAQMKMTYEPRYVLTEAQINGLLRGLRHQVRHG
jgi:hypothetical protein